MSIRQLLPVTAFVLLILLGACLGTTDDSGGGGSLRGDADTTVSDLSEDPSLDLSDDSVVPDTPVDDPTPDLPVDDPTPDTTVDDPTPDTTVDDPTPDLPVDDPTPDLPVDEPPSITITSPAEGAELYGTVEWTVDTSDDRGVVSVQFFVDSGLLATDTQVPFSTTWDTEAFANGSHTLRATAIDTNGQPGEDTIQVTTREAPSGFCDYTDAIVLELLTESFMTDVEDGCRDECGEEAECFIPCVQETIPVTQGCTLCIYLHMTCTWSNCEEVCTGEATSADCQTCQTEYECMDLFLDCAY